MSEERWEPFSEKPKGELEGEVEKGAPVARGRRTDGDWLSALADVNAFLGYFPFKVTSSLP